jgi:hypothetical protein
MFEFLSKKEATPRDNVPDVRVRALKKQPMA